MFSKTKFSVIDLTRYYILALLIVGTLAVGSHMLERGAIENQQGAGAVINLSGRQRMLSQRIASLAAQYRLGDVSARAALLQSTDQFEAAHETLAKVYASGKGTSPAWGEMHELYFGGANSLDAQMQAFVAEARRVAAMQPNDPAMPAVLASIFAEARLPLLQELDHIVVLHQAESERRVSEMRRLQWTILTIMLATLMLEALLIFRPMVSRIVTYNAEIVKLATIDSLTGAMNRREFMTRCRAEFERVQRYGQSLSVIVLDIDHFKAINDTYGHAAGDAALKCLSEGIRKQLGRGDLLARLGGEEFVVLTPETTVEQAMVLAERLRLAIAEIEVPYEEQTLAMTVSLGVAGFDRDDDDIAHTLQLADKRLYEAKRTGRNRVVGELRVLA